MDFEIVIIGAGVVGLAIAAELSKTNKNVLLVEKMPTFGNGTSSRNSEVIHSGIYYPTNSLKATLCVEGNRLMYEWCDKYNVPHNKIGKFIVAVNSEDEENLYKLYEQGNINSVNTLEFISSNKLKNLEPNISSTLAIFSPTTGIVDSHSLMQSFEAFAINNGLEIVYNHNVVEIEKKANGYKITLKFGDSKFDINSEKIINSAGLYADQIAQLIGLDIAQLGYKQTFCRGHYFKTTRQNIASHLIYPVPEKNWSGIGVHITLDLAGNVKFGPDVMYLPENIEDYTIPIERKQLFYESIKRYLPSIKIEDLQPDQAGIRPKIQKQGEAQKDFIISEESNKDFPGMINLIGIESPGLTSSLAIAKYVKSLL
ncbi:MAG: NAD(P)/FAD-dependent oxidoreductase [Candidatus Kapaibacteriota bacterium]